MRPRFRVAVCAIVVAASGAAGCGGGGGESTQGSALADLQKCLTDAGATKATSASDLAFATSDASKLHYEKTVPANIAGTTVYETLSTSDPGYAVFVVAQPGSGAANYTAALSDPSSVAGVYFIQGERPRFKAAEACIATKG